MFLNTSEKTLPLTISFTNRPLLATELLLTVIMNLSKCIYFPSPSLLSVLSQLSGRFFWSQDLISRSPISLSSVLLFQAWDETSWTNTLTLSQVCSVNTRPYFMKSASSDVWAKWTDWHFIWTHAEWSVVTLLSVNMRSELISSSEKSASRSLAVEESVNTEERWRGWVRFDNNMLMFSNSTELHIDIWHLVCNSNKS